MAAIVVVVAVANPLWEGHGVRRLRVRRQRNPITRLVKTMTSGVCVISVTAVAELQTLYSSNV